jgi:hypothetical protein
VAPDDAAKPYTYTITYGDGDGATGTSGEDPLTAPLDHVFVATGTYEVTIEVWNCARNERESDSVEVFVVPSAGTDRTIYLPLVVRDE